MDGNMRVPQPGKLLFVAIRLVACTPHRTSRGRRCRATSSSSRARIVPHIMKRRPPVIRHRFCMARMPPMGIKSDALR